MNQDMPISYRRMEPENLRLISELDRSEHITSAYEIKEGALTQVEVDWNVPTWFVDTDGDHSLSEQLAFCQSYLDQGGVMLGGFDFGTPDNYPSRYPETPTGMTPSGRSQL